MKQIIVSILLILLMLIPVTATTSHNYSINVSSKGYKISITPNIINTTIHAVTYLGYHQGITTNNYNIYFLNNTNLDSPLRFEKDGYFFIYDISQGTMTWIGRPGQPAATDTLGGGASSNSLDTVAVTNNNVITYPGAYYNTNLTYQLQNNMIKETFILGGVPSFKTYDFLQYSGNIRFNASLKICTDVQCFTPRGTQDDFETSGKIYFKDTNNNTVFYLKEPLIIDAAGRTTLGLYSVHGSNAQMNFWLRINRTWLQSATFPVYIDPTEVIDVNGSLIINLSDDIYNPLQQIILYNVSGSGEILFETQMLNGVRYTLNPLSISFSAGHIDIKNATAKCLLKCMLWDYFNKTCGVNNTGSWATVKSIIKNENYDVNFNNTDPAYSEADEEFELNTLNYIEQSANDVITFSTKLLQSNIEVHDLTNSAAYSVNDINCGMVLNNTDTGIIIVSTLMLYDDFTESYQHTLLITPELYYSKTNTTMPTISNYTANVVCTGGRLGETTKTDNIDIKINL